MDSISLLQETSTTPEALEAELDALESEMPNIQARPANMFVLAGAWAERHNAIVAAAPPAALEAVEARLRRIGIRWGMMPGARMTAQFPALPAAGDTSTP